MLFIGLGIGFVVGAVACWAFIYWMGKVAAKVNAAIETGSERP